jgi:DNA-binding CsgD family transcriptional regulator
MDPDQACRGRDAGPAWLTSLRSWLHSGTDGWNVADRQSTVGSRLVVGASEPSPTSCPLPAGDLGPAVDIQPQAQDHMQLRTQDAGGRSQSCDVRAFVLDGQRIHRRHRRREVQVTIYRRRLVASARPGFGWTALTESELTVVRLIAQGLTNRETAVRLFVSPRTVNSHLRHALAKLSVNSRVELAHAVAAHARGAVRDN